MESTDTISTSPRFLATSIAMADFPEAVVPTRATGKSVLSFPAEDTRERRPISRLIAVCECGALGVRPPEQATRADDAELRLSPLLRRTNRLTGSVQNPAPRSGRSFLDACARLELLGPFG